jgi:hypothetical protein
MIFLIEQDGSNLNRFVEVSAAVLKERDEKALHALGVAKFFEELCISLNYLLPYSYSYGENLLL